MTYLHIFGIILAVSMIVWVLYELREDYLARRYVKEIEDCLNRSLVEATAARSHQRSIPIPVTFNEFNPAPRSTK